SNAEFIILKLCIASAYVLIGAYFHDFFLEYHWFFLVLFLITVFCSVRLWLQKMKSKNEAT
ncbi:hypothetical protein ABTN43_19715, partial [Acinetobacter baumannii]